MTTQRFANNPILRPADCKPSQPDMVVECLLNPGVFRYKGRTGLLLRVAERPKQEEGWISTPVLDPASEGGIRILRFRKDDPDLKADDSRVFAYKGDTYLTTLSHLRLAWSDDGVHFKVDPKPTLMGEGAFEAFGVEDSRVTEIEGRFYLTYTVVSSLGVAVGMSSTADWKTFTKHGIVFPPHNKDCALFPEKIGGLYYAFHRPSGHGFGGNNIWMSQSPDLAHWGNHQCVAATRAGSWDAERIGAGAAPIRTPQGWLEIYHGADRTSRYALGLMLLDSSNPYRVLARSVKPVLQPEAPYELTGFFGKVVFTNGHVVEGDKVTVYYGASDEVICGVVFSLKALLASLT